MKLGIILVLAGAGIADPVSITGRASIVDGDTIEIQGRRVRLNGVDAPETRQLRILSLREDSCGCSGWLSTSSRGRLAEY